LTASERGTALFCPRRGIPLPASLAAPDAPRGGSTSLHGILSRGPICKAPPCPISEFFFLIAALTRCTVPDPTFSSRAVLRTPLPKASVARIAFSTLGSIRAPPIGLPLLAQLHRFEHLEKSKYLRLLRWTPEGRRYSGVGGTGAAVILAQPL
jgi:hypothetical protein